MRICVTDAMGAGAAEMGWGKHMAMSQVICPRCGLTVARGTRYCPRCGEALDADLVVELRQLYATIIDLNARIKRGQGQDTITDLRDELQARYLALRSTTPATTAATASATAGVAAPATTPFGAPAATPAPASRPATPMGAPITPPLSGAPVTPAFPPTPRPPVARPYATPVTPSPVFSWRAFVAEQAIAIMAYLGGFLLLLATLTFEIGGWQVLPDPVKFAAVSVVYIVFAALGFALRQSTHLRTVGRAYLAIFALMTPLVALAAYRFILQGQGFSATGMLCLSSFYAAVVYLLLAWRTRFSTYSYLGWVAFLVGAGAIVPWSAAPLEWSILDLAVVGLVLLAPRRLTEMDRRGEWQTDWRVVAEPATQIGAFASIGAALGVVLLGLNIWGTYGSGASSGPSLAAFALAACAITPLAAGWSLTLRDRQRRAPEGLLGFVDWCTPAFAALAVIALVAWASASTGETTTLMAYTLALLGIGEAGAALVVRRARPQRNGLRYGVEGLAIALTAVGALIVFQRPDPNLPLIVALTAALIVALVGSGFENALGWGLVAGLFLSVDMHTIFNALVPNLPSATFSPQNDALPGVLRAAASLQTALALLIWLVALALGEVLPRPTAPAQPAAPRPIPVWPPTAAAQRSAETVAAPITPRLPPTPVAPTPPPYARPRAFLAPLYLTALGDALFAALLLFPHTSGYQTTVLLVFAGAGLIAGWRIRAGDAGAVVGGLVVGFFGFFATLTALLSNRNDIWIAAYMIAFAVATLAIRRLLGRSHAIGPYAVTCWAAFIGGNALFNFPYYFAPPVYVTGWSALGVPFAAWALLVVAALLSVYAFWERKPGLMTPPALVVLFAQLHTLPGSVNPWVPAIFALALAPLGLLLRWRRGPGWGAALYAVAVPASLVAVYRFESQGPGNWPVLAELLLIVFAALVYVVAWRERLPGLTAVAILYALGALALVPQHNQFAATMVLTIGAAALAIIVRARVGRRWALALYAMGVLGTLFAGPRVTPPDGAHIEATLLVFAALAYAIAYFEDTPVAGIAPVIYALFAVIFQPDPHGLLPMALILAVVGLIAGRVSGPRWSWPAYAAAAIAAVGTAYQGQSQPTFEAISLLSLAVLAYVIAAVESRADSLPLAFVLGALGVAATANAAHWSAWEVTLAYAVLAWGYALLGRAWRALPWLRARGGAWWARGMNIPAQAQWRDSRYFGVVIHRWAAVIVGAGALVAAWLTGQSFTTHDATTQATALALLSLAGLLTYTARETQRQSLYYVAGEFVALAFTWEARWLGADNLQWFVLAPGTYHLLIGALLPADERMGRPRRLGQAASALGSLILLAPTLGQSFQAQPNWLYALILTFEALVIAGIGVGTRSRLLVVVGTAFIGLAALRGAALAVGSGLPTPLVIGVVALLLMGAATWLSLRARRNATPTAP